MLDSGYRPNLLDERREPSLMIDLKHTQVVMPQAALVVQPVVPKYDNGGHQLTAQRFLRDTRHEKPTGTKWKPLG